MFCVVLKHQIEWHTETDQSWLLVGRFHIFLHMVAGWMLGYYCINHLFYENNKKLLLLSFTSKKNTNSSLILIAVFLHTLPVGHRFCRVSCGTKKRRHKHQILKIKRLTLMSWWTILGWKNCMQIKLQLLRKKQRNRRHGRRKVTENTGR